MPGAAQLTTLQLVAIMLFATTNARLLVFGIHTAPSQASGANIGVPKLQRGPDVPGEREPMLLFGI